MRNLLVYRFDMEVALVDPQALSCTNVNLHTVMALVNGTYTSIESASTQCSGRVILMTDNPDFRAFWYGTNILFLNGIFFRIDHSPGLCKN